MANEPIKYLGTEGLSELIHLVKTDINNRIIQIRCFYDSAENKIKYNNVAVTFTEMYNYVTNNSCEVTLVIPNHVVLRVTKYTGSIIEFSNVHNYEEDQKDRHEYDSVTIASDNTVVYRPTDIGGAAAIAFYVDFTTGELIAVTPNKKNDYTFGVDEDGILYVVFN